MQNDMGTVVTILLKGRNVDEKLDSCNAFDPPGVPISRGCTVKRCSGWYLEINFRYQYDRKGEVIEDAYGRNPTGFLTYTPDGRMMAIITWSGRKRPSIWPAPAQEQAEAFSTFLAYAGRYTFSSDRVIHHIEAAWRQDWVNTDQVRFIVKLQDNRATLRTPPFVSINGVRMANQELGWERLKVDSTGH